MLIDLVDNTDLGHGLDRNIRLNQNNQMRLTVPNEGLTQEGKRIHFFSHGLKNVKGGFWLDQKNIFLQDGKLLKNGLIVYKHSITARNESVELEETTFFKVDQSNIEGINKGFIVIVNARTAYRFNKDKKEYFFVNPENVFLVFKGDKINAGPNFFLFEKEVSEVNGVVEEKENSGLMNGNRYYFDDADYEIEYDSKQYLVVNKDNVKLIDKL